MRAKTSLKHIIVSSTRKKLIEVLFYRPGEIFYVRQLVRLVDEEINSVRHELENLKKGGLVESETRGNRLYYWANPSSDLFTDLVILAHKSSGLNEALQEKKAKIGQFKALLCSYNYLINDNHDANDIDLIIVGDVSVGEVDSAIKTEEKSLGREINYMIMDKSELQIRKNKRDPFIVDFFLNCPFIIYGNPKELANL